MQEEIKEILDKFDKVLKNYELDKKFGQISVDSICHLFPNEMIAIKDYITNLQESDNDKQLEIMKLKDKLEQQRKEYQETYKDVRIEIKEKNETITNLQEELKLSHQDNLELVKENERLNMVVTIQEDYKSRNEKAIEYINSTGYGTDFSMSAEEVDKVFNILQGVDKE